jgi:UDP:flavonoid glycosyltransferase YjiC (YdhE family)
MYNLSLRKFTYLVDIISIFDDSLGQALLAAGHRVRLATHNTFRKFVRGNGLEFFPLAGDPADLMSFMVKNSGIIPSISSIAAGDLTKNRDVLTEILASTWRACTLEDDETGQTFTAEAIIANPPSFGHIHCAQKLQIPLHIIFTMPWSPTTAFPHPLVNIDYSKASIERVNMLSYTAIEMFVSIKNEY